MNVLNRAKHAYHGATPRRTNIQLKTWERLLNALERLEQVNEASKNISRLDAHPDGDEITEGEVDVRSEVHLQLMCLQQVIRPVSADAGWMAEDFLSWFGGREPRPRAAADEYAVPVLKCVRGERFRLPPLPKHPLASPEQEQASLMDAVDKMAWSPIEADQTAEEFRRDPEKKVTQYRHPRGTVDGGLNRLGRLGDGWAMTFISDFVNARSAEPLVEQLPAAKTLPEGPDVGGKMERADARHPTGVTERSAVPGAVTDSDHTARGGGGAAATVPRTGTTPAGQTTQSKDAQGDGGPVAN